MLAQNLYNIFGLDVYRHHLRRVYPMKSMKNTTTKQINMIPSKIKKEKNRLKRFILVRLEANCHKCNIYFEF